MISMDKEIVDRYIALPLAINVFKQDRENFQKFKMRNVYLDLLDAAIEKASLDFYDLKKVIISKHHLSIKRIDGLRYTVNGNPVEYTAEKLKKLTDELMQHYISTVDIEWD